MNLLKFKILKNDKSEILTCFSNIEGTGKFMFLTLNAKEAFNHLKQEFSKALILQYFDLECHIWIETNASDYAINKVLHQLIFDWVTSNSKSNLTKSDFGQWYPVTYFFRKMIFVEI